LPVEETQVDAAVHRRLVGEEGSARRYGNNCENVRLGRRNMRRSIHKVSKRMELQQIGKCCRNGSILPSAADKKKDVTKFMPTFIKKCIFLRQYYVTPSESLLYIYRR